VAPRHLRPAPGRHPEVDGPLLAGWWAGTTPAPNYPIGEVLAGASRNAANATRLLEAFCRVAAGG
jgi:hypothetical protein